MSSDIRETIQEQWRDSRMPQLDGVVFADGSVVLMNCSSLLDSETRRIRVSVTPLARTTMDSVLEFNDDPWIYATTLCTFEWVERGERLVCGEGEMGNEGFVASCDASDGSLRWIAFFTCSNPFTKVCVAEGSITAVTTHDHVWRFPPDSPERVQVQCG